MNHVQRMTFHFPCEVDWKLIEDIIRGIDREYSGPVRLAYRTFAPEARTSSVTVSYDCCCDVLKLSNIFDKYYVKHGIVRELAHTETVSNIAEDCLNELGEMGA